MIRRSYFISGNSNQGRLKPKQVFRRPSFIRNKTKQGRARYFIVWVNRKTVRIAEILFLVSQTMIRHPKIAAHTRYAFICIGLMMLSFLIYVVLAVFDLGLDMSMRIALTRFALILILLFAFLGGVFSIWVAVLRKKMGGMT